MSGGELFDRIAAEDYKMSEAEVINYMRQVCDGLRHMHENSIVHLDVKVNFEKSLHSTVKILKIGTPEIITIIVLQLEQLDFTVQYCVQKMQTE